MVLESLPNELMLSLFDYLSLVQLFQAFYGLNSRFNTLVLVHCRKCHLDFRLMAKTNFDAICNNYLPSIVDGVISLGLSDDDNTPQQIGLFLSHNFHLKQFINLQTVSLSNIRCPYILDKLITECFHAVSLTHLTLADCHIQTNRDAADRLYNKIWMLPKLTYCWLDINVENRSYFPLPSIRSTSLKHLSISNISCYFNELIRMFQLTPNLQRLSIDFIDYATEYDLSMSRLSITRLKLSFDSSWNILQYLLQNMPDLYHLTLETCNIYVSGHQWEELVENYLPKLKIFQFKMRFSSLNANSKEIQTSEILDSFRTKFWVDEHQWLVRCHWYSSDEQYQLDFVDLFTLPYAFKEFLSYTGCTLAKSTCPNDNEYWSYDRVNTLCYGSSHFTNSIISRVRFSNIQSLTLSLPFNAQFFCVISKLNQLKSLSVSINNHKKVDNIMCQLQMVLNSAPYLNSLSVGAWSSSGLQVSMLKNATKSIRKLNLQGYAYGKNWFYFDDEQCHQLSASSIGFQCETLLIRVKNRRNILDIVNGMHNLRALNVRCEDDLRTYQTNILPSTEDEYLEWLRLQLPSSIIITRETHNIHTIRLWIR